MKTRLFGLPVLLLLFLFAFQITTRAQVWNREIADSSGINMGSFCKIALDSDDNPVIVHCDYDFMDLRLLKKSGNTWSVEKVDTSGYTGWSPGIAIDSDDSIHLCFDNGTLVYNPSGTFGVNYMTQHQDGWQKEKLEDYEIYLPQQSTSIALTSVGEPVMGYWNQNDEHYYLAYRHSGEWIKKQSPYTYISTAGIRLKSDDTPVILFNKEDSLLLVTYTEATDTWEEFHVPFHPAPNMDVMGNKSFTIDPDDNVQMVINILSYETIPFSYNVTHLKYDWSQWENEIVTSDIFMAPVRIAVDSHSNPAVLTFAGSPMHLTMFRKENGAWKQESVDPNCENFLYAEMAFDRSNQPHIVVQAKPEDIISQKEQMAVYYSFSPGLPDLTYHPGELQFGNVWTESYRVLPVSLLNSGVASLIIGGSELDNTDVFSLKGPTFPAYVSPGDSLQFEVKFTPAETESYSDILTFATNDKVAPLLEIPVSGTGVSTGLSSVLELSVKDVYADFTNMLIDQDDPLEGVAVSLFQGNVQLGSTQISDHEGLALFDALTPGIYTVRLTKDADQADTDMDCSREELITLGPGYNSMEFCLADSLFHYQVWLKNKLKNLRETGNFITPTLNYSGAMNKVSSELSPHAADFDPEYTECLVRLLLVEYMVHDLFEEGYALGDEMFKDFGELIAFIFYSNDWAARILDMLLTLIQAIFQGNASDLFQEIMQMLMEELIKNEIYHGVSESLMMVGGEIGPPADDVLLEAWHQVWRAYSSGWNFSFGTEQWGRIIMKVKDALEAPFIQEVYVEQLTAPKITKGLDYAMDNRFNGSFFEAYENEIDYVSNEKNTVEMSLDAATFFRQSGELLMVTASIFNWLGTLDFVPYSQIVDQVGFYMKMTAYIEVVTALGISTGKFFVVPSNMGKTVDKIFFPEGKSKKSLTNLSMNQAMITSPADQLNMNQLKASMISESRAYSDILEEMKNSFQTGDRLDAASNILPLREAEKQMNNSTMRALSPTIAVASNALEDLDGFETMWDSLKVYHARARQERFLTYFRLMFAIVDTSGDSDLLITELIDKNLRAQEEQNEMVSDLLDTVTAHMALPAVLVPTVTGVDRQRLDQNEQGKVQLQITNTGAVNAEGVYLLVECNEALEISGSDSIYIGSLVAGETNAEIALTFNCTDNSFALGTWNVTLRAENARVLPISGSFNLGATTSVRQHTAFPAKEQIAVYPNPVTNNATISYMLDHPAKINISLFDLAGKRIRILLDREQGPGKQSLTFEPKNLKSGFYYLVLKKDNRITAKQKVMVIDSPNSNQ